VMLPEDKDQIARSLKNRLPTPPALSRPPRTSRKSKASSATSARKNMDSSP
jgi:hypothetical protein